MTTPVERWGRSVLAAAVLAVPAAGAAQGHYLSDQAQCRLSFGNSVRDLASVTALRVEICHRNRMKGTVPVSVNCSDPATWAGAGYTDGAEGRQRDLDRFAAESAFCSPGITTPAEVGYTSCPAPCGALPVTTFPELGECLECFTAAGALVVMQDAHGTPPAPSLKGPRKCLEAVGRGIVRYINKRMLRQHTCQFLKDIGEPGYDAVQCAHTNNPSHPDYERAQRTVEKIRNQITRRCAEVDFATTLDTCGTEPVSEHACVISLVDDWTADLMTALYPPLP